MLLIGDAYMGRRSKKDTSLVYCIFLLTVFVIIKNYPWVLGIALTVGVIAIAMYLFAKHKRNKFKYYDISYLDKMNPYDFEEYVCKLYKGLGYNQSRCTSGSGDFGADVIAENKHEKITVQVKRYNQRKSVGSDVVQKILGAQAYYHATSSAIVTTSYFTEPAKKMAQSCRVKLIDRDELKRILMAQKRP